MRLGNLAMCACVSFWLCSASAHAQSAPHIPTLAVEVTAGTFGVGPEVTYRVNRNIGLRAGASFLKASRGIQSDGVQYQGDLKLGSWGAMVDLYPMSGHFRMSAGFRVNKGTRLNMTATPAGPTTIGNTTYTPAQIGNLSGTVRVSDIAPVLTIGWAGGLTKGVKLGFDAGAMLSGSPKMRDISASNSAITAADINAQKDKINRELGKIAVYPVVQASLGYAF